MELAEALDVLIAREGHARWRDLCDPAHPDYNPAYIPLVLELAKDPGPQRPAPAPLALPLAGDIVAMAAHRIGADRLAKWVAAKLGTDCGCERRRVALNRLDASLRRYLARGDR